MRNERPSDPRRGGSGTVVPVTPGVDVDLLVVGAGPAGIAAAVEAHRLGLSVTVVDKAGFPRDKTCGDGLTTGALRLLDDLGFDVRALPSYAKVTETVLVSPTGREVVVPLPTDGEYAGVAPRIELDAALVHHARSRGVDIRERVAITDLCSEADRVVATLGNGDAVGARWVVAADGHYSSVRRILDHRESAQLGTWHAFRQYFTDVEDRRLWVLFEKDFLPGYAWVFPVGEHGANVGFGVLRDRAVTVPVGRTEDASPGKMLAAQWRGLAARPNLRRALGPTAQAQGAARAWPIPARYDRGRLARGRVLFAGDAASVVDPMTGEGIAQALETGRLAAQAVARTPDNAEAVAAHYRASVDLALGRDLRFASLLQLVLASSFGARAAIGVAALTPWTRRNFARWMFEDYPRALALTPTRWHRGMFTGSGAYGDMDRGS
jgi:geranylgeranyl reductase family protein